MEYDPYTRKSTQSYILAGCFLLVAILGVSAAFDTFPGINFPSVEDGYTPNEVAQWRLLVGGLSTLAFMAAIIGTAIANTQRKEHN